MSPCVCIQSESNLKIYSKGSGDTTVCTTMWASGWVQTLLKNTHIHTCVFCSCVNTWNYSITLLRPEHTLTHKAKGTLVLRRMEKAAASTEVLSHLHDSVHKCSTLTFFTTLTRTWQKIFCCVKSEMGTKPSGGHISVTESQLHYFGIVHSGLGYLFLVSFLETITPTNNLHLFGKKEAFIAAGVRRHDVSVHTDSTNSLGE